MGAFAGSIEGTMLGLQTGTHFQHIGLIILSWIKGRYDLLPWMSSQLPAQIVVLGALATQTLQILLRARTLHAIIHT